MKLEGDSRVGIGIGEGRPMRGGVARLLLVYFWNKIEGALIGTLHCQSETNTVQVVVVNGVILFPSMRHPCPCPKASPSTLPFAPFPLQQSQLSSWHSRPHPH